MRFIPFFLALLLAQSAWAGGWCNTPNTCPVIESGTVTGSATETNDLETTQPPTIEDDEIFLGTGSGTGSFTTFAGQIETRYWVYNVEDYGAIPNDGLNDTAAFQQASDDCTADNTKRANISGGIVYVPVGEYHLDDADDDTIGLQLENCALHGVTAISSVLRWNDSDTTEDRMIFIPDGDPLITNTKHTRIANLLLKNEGTNEPGWFIDWADEVDMFGQIRDLHISDGARNGGIRAQGITNFLANWIRFDNWGPGYAIQLEMNTPTNGNSVNIGPVTFDRGTTEHNAGGFLNVVAGGADNLGVVNIWGGRLETTAPGFNGGRLINLTSNGFLSTMQVNLHNIYVQVGDTECTDSFDTGGPPQTSGSPDGLCDDDAVTTVEQTQACAFGYTDSSSAFNRGYSVQGTNTTIEIGTTGQDQYMCGDWGSWVDELDESTFTLSGNWSLGMRTPHHIYIGNQDQPSVILAGPGANDPVLAIVDQNNPAAFNPYAGQFTWEIDEDGDMSWSLTPGSVDNDVNLTHTVEDELHMDADDAFCLGNGSRCLRWNSGGSCIYFDTDDSGTCGAGEALGGCTCS